MSPRRALAKTQKLLKTVSYKPGWTLTTDLDGEVLHIRANYRTLCASGNGEEITVELDKWRITSGIDGYDCIKKMISEMLDMAAVHEVDEWLKFDGKHYRNPHPELR